MNRLEGPEFYFEGGFLVFTEVHHLKRGACCGSGCRHCPFEPRGVPGNRRVACGPERPTGA